MELQPEHSIAWIERNIPYTSGPSEIPRRLAQSRAAIDPRFGLAEFKAAKPLDVLMSAIGPKRTSLVAPHMSAFGVAIGGKADMTYCAAYVCL